MKTAVIVIGIFACAVAPTWILAKQVGSDEIMKTMLGAAFVASAGGVAAIVKVFGNKDSDS